MAENLETHEEESRNDGLPTKIAAAKANDTAAQGSR